MAVTPDGTKLYVTQSNRNTVTVIDTATNGILATLPGFNSPWGVAITPDSSRAYVVSAGTLSVIDTATNTVTHILAVAGSADGIAITPDGRGAYVTSFERAVPVAVIDVNPSSPTYQTQVASVGVGGDNVGLGVAINPDGTRVYEANYGANTVSVINTATNTLVATIPSGGFSVGAAITCDLPTGETTISDGWANDVTCFDPFAPPEPCATVHKWRQILTPTTIDFSGRTVIERDPGGGGPDTCWFPTSRYLPADAITGGSWLVGSGNNWGPDFVGYIPQRVRYDRDSGRAPCGTRFPQKMTISCPLNYPAYVTNELTMDIGLISVSSGRAGQTQTRIWP